jgi:hypothetical protein
MLAAEDNCGVGSPHPRRIRHSKANRMPGRAVTHRARLTPSPTTGFVAALGNRNQPRSHRTYSSSASCSTGCTSLVSHFADLLGGMILTSPMIRIVTPTYVY